MIFSPWGRLWAGGVITDLDALTVRAAVPKDAVISRDGHDESNWIDFSSHCARRFPAGFGGNDEL
jgi:hypothetical protein